MPLALKILGVSYATLRALKSTFWGCVGGRLVWYYCKKAWYILGMYR
jgi:hypothetical protein